MASKTIHPPQNHLLLLVPWPSRISLHLWMVQASVRYAIGATQYTQIQCLVLSGCWSLPERGHDDHSPTDVQKPTQICATKDQMATSGRKPMVPSPSRLHHALLDCCSRSSALRELLQRRAFFGAS